MTLRIRSLSALVVVALCGLPSASSASPAPSGPAAGPAKKLLDRAVRAHGGRKVVESVKAIRSWSTGTRTLASGSPPVEVSSETLIAFPGRYRQHLTTPAGDVTTIVNGPRGYVKIDNAYQAMDVRQFAAVTEALARTPVALLQRHLARSLAAVLSGPNGGGGLALGDGAGMVVDPATGLIASVSYSGEFMGRQGTYTIAYDDYRATPSGLMYPHRSVASFDRLIANTARIDRLAVNPPFADGDFLTPYGRPGAIAP